MRISSIGNSYGSRHTSYSPERTARKNMRKMQKSMFDDGVGANCAIGEAGMMRVNFPDLDSADDFCATFSGR